MTEEKRGPKYTRRAILAGAATGAAAGLTNALSSEETSSLYGGTMALDKAYNVAGNLWIGPDSAKENVEAKDGRVYMASDTQVEYAGDSGAWDLMGAGSSSQPLPSVHTEEGHFGGVPWHDVTNYGAVGDGVTDDSQAIKDARNATSGTSVVWFPPGDYLMESEVDPNETFFAGPTDRSARIVIGDLGWAAPFENRAYENADQDPPRNFGFFNLEMDGSNGWTQSSYNYAQKHIYALTGYNMIIQNCYFHGSRATSLGCDSVQNAWYVNNRLENNGTDGETVGSNGIGVGIGLTDGVVLPTYILGNTIIDTAEFAIIFEQVGGIDSQKEWGLVVANNVIKDARVGIGVDGKSDGAMIANNLIDTGPRTDYGIRVGQLDSSHSQATLTAVTNNVIRGEANVAGLQIDADSTGWASANVMDQSKVILDSEFFVVNGQGKEGAGFGNKPGTFWEFSNRGVNVRNYNDGALWNVDLADTWRQIAPADATNLSGKTASVAGFQAYDDGTNTTGSGVLCQWDATNSQWVPFDGSATFV